MIGFPGALVKTGSADFLNLPPKKEHNVLHIADPLELLTPPPRIAQCTEDTFHWPPSHLLASPLPESMETISWLSQAVESSGLLVRHAGGQELAHLRFHSTGEEPHPTGQAHHHIGKTPPLGREGYTLKVGRDGLDITAETSVGFFRATTTLAQWIRIHGGVSPEGLPGLWVEDHPDFPNRGVLLDISRNKVPRLETLLRLVDLLANFKLNQLHLYTEHTFAYQGHETVWRHASPLTPDDIQTLEHHCHRRCVELVPNQNSFGHFHRWLIHPPYRKLAECPEGIDHPFSEQREPFGLCPTDPGSLKLLADLYHQLLPNFSSRLFNVGLDETLDLGLGRSAEACARSGPERVYLDFLHRVHHLVSKHDRRMMFWGDIILKKPELITELPADAIALEWGYEADHPFAADCQRFAEAGLDFYVCPGTGSWNSFGGRTHNALANLASAAVHGKAARSQGYLITDWGDNGHLQPLPVSYLPIMAGASFAWNTDSAAERQTLALESLLDLHVFDDRNKVLGRVARDLGNASHLTGAPPPGEKAINGSALFFTLLFAHKPAVERRGQGMTTEHLRHTREWIEECTTDLHRADPQGADGDFLQREFAWVRDILLMACDLGLERLRAGEEAPLNTLPASFRHEASQRLKTLIAERRELWLARHRPGGMEDSLARLERLTELLA
jgi:hypothetical protein